MGAPKFSRPQKQYPQIFLEVRNMQRFISKATLFLFTLLFLYSTPSIAQRTSDISVTGQVRERTEYTGKDFDSSRDNVWFHLLRARINVAASPADDVTAFVQIQDSRMFGEETNTLNDGTADAIDVHQAYIQVDQLFGTSFTARLGRQEINVGNQRLVGAVGWHNIGRSFDGVRFQYPMETGTLTMFAARLVGSMNIPDGQNLYGATGVFPLSDEHTLSIVALLDNNTSEISAGPAEGEHELSRYTTGATVAGGVEAFDYEVEAYFQGGNQGRGPAVDRASISAYLVSGKVGFVVSEDKNVRLGGLFTIVSGDDDFGDDEYGAFNTLFATNHKFYGFMDYFLNFGGSDGIGLTDLAVSLGMNPSELFRLMVDVHHFMADQVPAGANDTFGQEVDITGVYRYNRAVTFTVGLSAFFPGDLMGNRGDDTGLWGYLSTVVNL